MAVEVEKLLDYACTKFQSGLYDEALEAFVLAYSKGYEQEWVMNNIYSCYMAGNEEEFCKTFAQQAPDIGISYEDCILDFIPYRDGEYYIFDKEMGAFRGVFSVHDLQETESNPSLQNVEFSAAVLEMEWNWKEEKVILSEAKKRKVYIISHDLNRFLSFCKLPELAEYMQNIKIFADRQELQEYFHKNTSVYLPKIICGQEEDKKELIRIMDQEHKYRLTPEGRNMENVLLTIGIPTHDRGNLVLKRLENLLSMPYDAEIEIAISKNGTNFYQEEYKKVIHTADARINYYDHGKELKYNVNWAYVVEMAHGKYVLMVSDEDDVIIEALEHYFKLLHANSEVNLIRSKTSFQYRGINEKKYRKKGIEAFGSMFLKQNYLSGLIIRREDFLQENLLELEQFSDNPFYLCYPHEWWCAILSRKGDYMEEPIELINEKESVIVEETKKLRKEGIIGEEAGIVGDTSLPTYSTYEARLKQFQGQIDFITWFMKDNKDGMKLGLEIAFGKTGYLLELARRYNYKNDQFQDFVAQFLWMCLDAVDKMSLEEKQKVSLLQWAQKLGIDLMQFHEKLCAESVFE